MDPPLLLPHSPRDQKTVSHRVEAPFLISYVASPRGRDATDCTRARPGILLPDLDEKRLRVQPLVRASAMGRVTRG